MLGVYDLVRSSEIWAITSDRESPCTDIFLSGPPPFDFVRDPVLNSTAAEFNLWLSPDGLRIAFASSSTRAVQIVIRRSAPLVS